MASLTSVDDALALVLEHSVVLPPERVSIADACGRVLAEDVIASVDLPRFPSSAMDGFAVRSADTPAELPVIGRIAAGHPAERALAPGTAMGISTGGVVPEGADAVVPIEAVVKSAGRVRVPAAAAGEHIRPAGGDVARGVAVGRTGEVVTPARLAALAASGSGTVLCTRRPRVAVIATGSELRQPGSELGPGEIYESNGQMLAALVRGAGGEVVGVESIADDAAAHRAALVDALAADVVVTSGGVSVGPHDLVRATLSGLGVTEVLWGVAMRPGKPLAFGTKGATLTFGLPGNPVSSFVGATLFVVPALLARQGAARPGPAWLAGTLAEEARPRAFRDDFVRATLSVDGRLTPLAQQESHMIVAAAAADALVRLRAGSDPLPAGSPVDYLRLDVRPSGA